MSIIFHILTRSANPRMGGMQQSIQRIAQWIAQMKDATVILYTLTDDNDGGPTVIGNVHLKYLRPLRDELSLPLMRSMMPRGEWELNSAFIDYLVCKNAVATSLQEYSTGHHIILSFYITSMGYVAQQISDTLGCPHIASTRGTDFTRDIRSPSQFSAFEYVIRRASHIVTNNTDQVTVLRTLFGRTAGVSTISNSTTVGGSALWERKERHPVCLFADCGYHFKKGTHILLRAVTELINESLPLRLQIVGNTHGREGEFWNSLKAAYSQRFSDRLLLGEWIPPESIVSLMRSSDVYCSATLGEGCSNARLTALTLGIPMVTTRTGEINDLTTEAQHIRLAEAGDFVGFKRALGEMVTAVLNRQVYVSKDLVDTWRHLFSPEVERRSWQTLCRMHYHITGEQNEKLVSSPI